MINLPAYLRMELKFAQIMQEMADYGIYLDIERCQALLEQLNSEIEPLDQKLVAVMPRKEKQLTTIKAYTKAGAQTVNAAKFMQTGMPYRLNDDGSMDRWKVDAPNPASGDQLREYLLSIGWKPRSDYDAWNWKKDPNGPPIRMAPKLPKQDAELDELSKTSPIFQTVADRLKRGHRRSNLQGYLKNVRDDNRIPMVVNSCGCNTMRVTHSVVANVPRSGSYFGNEFRSVLRASPSRELVGADMSGQEARVLAHYLGSDEFSQFVVDEDIHTWFLNLLKDYVSGRSQAKNIEYAYLYGAGDTKLGSMADLLPKSTDQKSAGGKIRRILDAGIPNMKQLKDKLELQFNQNNAIQGIDGRWIPARKRHALVNTLCQSAGAIIAKNWTCKVDSVCSTLGDTHLIIFFHDEIIYETSPNLSLQVGQVMIDSLQWVQDYLKLSVPLHTEYKIGKTWSDVK